MPPTPARPGSGADPVPLTVWTTRATNTTQIPADILRRVLDTYTRPGDLVITTATAPPETADVCVATGRRHRSVNTEAKGEVPPWILVDRHPTAAALVLHVHIGTVNRTALAATYSILTELLRPGGILLTVLPLPAPSDPLTGAVAAARGAGLHYLQHLLALQIPVPEGLLMPNGAAWDPADDPTLPTPLPPLRLHTDIAVFRSSR